MVRTDRIWPDVYFGRPGQLVKMPWPRGGIVKPFDRQVYDFSTGSGMHQVSSLAGGSRQYAVTWKALHVDNYSILARYWTGMAGAGPWTILDPSMPNLLLPNQAAATSVFYDTRDWFTNGAANHGTLLSNAAGGITQQGLNARNLRWYFNAATGAATPTLNLTTPYRQWYGFPVTTALPYAWSVWARPDGVVDSAITMRVQIQWLNLAGGAVSTSAGTDTSMTGWTRLSVLATPPPGAVWAKLVLVAQGTTITTGASIYVEDPLFEQDTVVNDWAPGTGIRPVEILDLSDGVPFNTRFREGVTMTLRELAQ